MVSMKKLLSLSLILIFLVGCKKTPQCGETSPTSTNSSTTETISTNGNCDPGTPSPEPLPQEPDPEPSPEPTPEPDPVPAPDTTGDLPQEAYIFDAVVEFTNFGSEDEAKVYKAIEIIKKVVASTEFRQRIIDFTYQGKKQFVDNKGLSNEQIYQIILDGKEDLKPEVDNEMDLELELYYSWRSTVGYTYPNTLRIWMNTKFFNYYTPTEVAGNIFHEWTHKLGFEHASSYSTSRDSSVPYAIGYLIEELGKVYE